MTDENYGYEKPNVGSMAQYDTYTYGETVDWQSTDFGDSKNDIQMFWTWVRSESDEKAFAACEYWRRVATILETTATNLRRHTDSLLEKWKSPAADDFARRVGAALHSLDEWAEIATNNANGISSLAVVIAQTQQNVKPIWEEFLRVDKEEKDKRDKDDASFRWLADIGDGGEDADDIRKRYTDRAKPHVEALAKMYFDTYIQKMSTGGKYKGPVNAVAANDPKFNPQRPGMPGRPGGGPTRPGTRPGTPTNRPDRPAPPPARPELTDRPEAPVRPEVGSVIGGVGKPDEPELAGVIPPPPAPPPVTTPPPPPPPPSTIAPPPPVVPGPAPAPPGGPKPISPTFGPTNQPGKPGLPPGPPPGGPGGPGGRGGAAPPPLGKRAGQGSPPMRPGPTPPPPLGRNRPTTRPTGPTAPPASLGGPRGGAAPGKKPPVRPAALGEAPNSSGPPRAVTPPPGLGGRRIPGEKGTVDLGSQQPQRGVPAGLQGRSSGVPSEHGRVQSGRPAGGRHEDDVWSVDETDAAAPAVIDAPEEKVAKPAGPALGSTS